MTPTQSKTHWQSSVHGWCAALYLQLRTWRQGCLNPYFTRAVNASETSSQYILLLRAAFIQPHSFELDTFWIDSVSIEPKFDHLDNHFNIGNICHPENSFRKRQNFTKYARHHYWDSSWHHSRSDIGSISAFQSFRYQFLVFWTLFIRRIHSENTKYARSYEKPFWRLFVPKGGGHLISENVFPKLKNLRNTKSTKLKKCLLQRSDRHYFGSWRLIKQLYDGGFSDQLWNGRGSALLKFRIFAVSF